MTVMLPATVLILTETSSRTAKVFSTVSAAETVAVRAAASITTNRTVRVMELPP